MIRIDKPAEAPEVLRTSGKNERRSLSNRYTRGEREFTFKSSIYGHKTVKDALIDAQHGKCAFCESKVTHVAYGDVEHFRPKKGVRQQAGDELERPGYYWLAYEWSNLLFACQLCNQRQKRNLFPLHDAALRARSHRDDLAQEEPLFIQPAEENPEAHIGFRQEMVFGKSEPGRVTVEALGLNRAALSEKRRDYYVELRLLRALAHCDPPIPESGEARAFLQKAVGAKSEYAAMARAAIASEFQV